MEISSREITNRTLDSQNTNGKQIFSLFKETIEMERNILEYCMSSEPINGVVGVKPKVSK